MDTPNNIFPKFMKKNWQRLEGSRWGEAQDDSTGTQNLPGGPVVKNWPANAGNTALIPGSGRSHVPQVTYAHAPQLLACALELVNTATSAQMLLPLSLCTLSPSWSETREAHALQLESRPRSPQLKPHARRQRPRAVKETVRILHFQQRTEQWGRRSARKWKTSTTQPTRPHRQL